MKVNVIIHLHGMERFFAEVEADSVRQAIDAAWGKWSLEVAHPTRVLAEHKRELDIFATPVS